MIKEFMDFSPEVLIYVQSVKKFLDTDEGAKNYFINGDEDFFYKHLCEISQKNYNTSGMAELTQEQFELIRKTMFLIYRVLNKEYHENPEDKLFIDYKEYGKFGLN